MKSITRAALLLAIATAAATFTSAQGNEDVNIIVSGGNGGSVAGDFSIVRSDDVTIRNDYISEMLPVVAEPLELVPFFTNLVNPEGGKASAFIYKDREAGTQDWYVQVVYPEFQREAVHAIYEVVNQPGATSSSGGVRRHFRVRNRLASELADLLERTTISGVGFVEADDATNTIIVRDSGSDGRRSLAVAAYHDVPPRMVELNVQIYEINVNDNAQLGLDWDAWKTSLSGFALFGDAERRGGGDFTSFDGLLGIDATALAGFLNYMVGTGNARVLTNSNLTAINGETAELRSLRDVPNVQYAGSGPNSFDYGASLDDTLGSDIEVSGDSRTAVNIGRDKEGFIVAFSPVIGIETMRADVECVISTVAGHSSINEPIIAQSELRSTLILIENETALLGSFDRTSTVEVESGIPLLKSIPFIGPLLFAVTREQTDQTKLVVLVTPSIDANTVYTDMDIDNGKPQPIQDYEPYYQIPTEYGASAQYDDEQQIVEAIAD